MPPRRKANRRRHRRPAKRVATKKLIREVITSTKEPKYALAGAFAALSSATGIITTPTMPAQGDAFNQREGDVLQWRKIYGDYFWQSRGETNHCRYTIIQWLPDTAVDAPTVAKIYQDSANPYLSPFIMNVAARKKFRVLHDKMTCLSLNGPQMVKHKINLNTKRMQRLYFNPGLATGKGIFIAIDSCDSVTANRPAISYELAYKWSDI